MFRGPGAGPGVILGPFFQNMLNMTEEQKKQLADLQKDVDEKLAKILTDEQKKQLAEIRQRFGPPNSQGPGPGRGRNPAPKKDE
jgi:hypothetical protein